VLPATSTALYIVYVDSRVVQYGGVAVVNGGRLVQEVAGSCSRGAMRRKHALEKVAWPQV
jgi:hypothetical protein